MVLCRRFCNLVIRLLSKLVLRRSSRALSVFMWVSSVPRRAFICAMWLACPCWKKSYRSFKVNIHVFRDVAIIFQQTPPTICTKQRKRLRFTGRKANAHLVVQQAVEEVFLVTRNTPRNLTLQSVGKNIFFKKCVWTEYIQTLQQNIWYKIVI